MFMTLLLTSLLAAAPAAAAGLPLPMAAAGGCSPAARFLPPELVLRLAPPLRARAAAEAEVLQPAEAVLRLFAERRAVERLHDEAGLPFKYDVCGEGRDRGVCLNALLRVEAAIEATAIRDIALHHALRALYLESGEEKLDAGMRGRLYAVLAQWVKERRESTFEAKKGAGYSICIFPARDVVDQVFLRAFTRRAVGQHHRLGADALLNMRFGPRFAPKWTADHPPVPVYC